MESSHSLFGIIYQVATETGWKPHFIKWKINFQELILMKADAPRYITEEEAEKTEKTGKRSALGFFQSQARN